MFLVYNDCKYIKPLLIQAKEFTSKLNSLDVEFPLDDMKKMIQVARDTLLQMHNDLNACTLIWNKLLRFIYLARSFYTDENYVSLLKILCVYFLKSLILNFNLILDSHES